MTQPQLSWGAKDPDALLDYIYTIPLEAEDVVLSYVFEKISGDAVIDSDSLDPLITSTDELERGQEVTAWISGGTDGEVNVFRTSWVTAGGREDNAIILLGIGANEPSALVLTGYAKPTPAHLITRYPAFAGVATATIQFWLTDAERYVDNSWTEGDYAAALMAMAAHRMAVAGLGTGNSLSDIPAGVTQMRSGSLSLSFSDTAAKDRAAGAFASTVYGSEYAALLRRNKGGPRVASTGAVPWDGIRYPQGQA